MTRKKIQEEIIMEGGQEVTQEVTINPQTLERAGRIYQALVQANSMLETIALTLREAHDLPPTWRFIFPPEGGAQFVDTAQEAQPLPEGAELTPA